MLSAWFDSTARLRALQAGPAGTLLDGFASLLSRSGFARLTARRHLRSAEHFAWWAARRGLWTSGVTSQVVDRFRLHVPRCRCRGYGRADPSLLHGVGLFLQHLDEAGIIKLATSVSHAPDPALLLAFWDWMREQRGTSDATLYNYAIHIRELLVRVRERPDALDARTLRQFVLEGRPNLGLSAMATRTTALRMFVRFLVAAGHSASSLQDAIPSLAHWRLASLPRYLPPDDVERLIASCDVGLPVGRRNRAILLLLARLGLRAGDIVQLRLSDLDWKGAWIRVSGKGRHEARLPLTQEVGEALVAYLGKDRPQTITDVVFVRHRAPLRAFRSQTAVSAIVARAFSRARVTRPSRGAAHLLRHSAATSMLRHGASLHDVAALLRHRSITTTQIYAKVDVTALKTIAQPWPEVPSC
jgi:site-specific recombinase XerD